jgi:hypothetical protein
VNEPALLVCDDAWQSQFEIKQQPVLPADEVIFFCLVVGNTGSQQGYINRIHEIFNDSGCGLEAAVGVVSWNDNQPLN